MDKNSNVRVVGFPKENYDKNWLDSIKDSERSEAACADGDTAIFEDLREFQDTVLNSAFGMEQLLNNYWYFLND
jgi:hypothetical protein